jgi:PEP-CTERM motif
VLFADFANSTPAGYPAVGQLSLFDTTTGNVITTVNIFAVPEPDAVALFAAGGIGFATAMRKRRTARGK